MKNITDHSEFILDIMSNSDGSEKKVGDFILRKDYGLNAYYVGPGGDVVIPEEVGKASLLFAFKEKPSTPITSVVFPSTIKSLGNIGLGGDRTMLRKLVFSEGTERLWDTDFFANCRALEEVELPESLKYLGARAFRNTPWYKKTVEIEDGCHYLGRFLVDSDKDIKNAVVREGTEMICGKAFMNRENLTKVSIPSGVEIIGAQAFLNCAKLKSIILPESVKRLEEWCFAGCSTLKRIEIPAKDAVISEDAFGKETFRGIFYPDYALIPSEIKGSPEQARFFAYCYLTSRDRHSAELREKNDPEVKKRKAKLLELIIKHKNMAALYNISDLAITKANIGKLIEEARNAGSAEITAYLLDLQNKMGGPRKADLSKQLDRDPNSAAELRKSWNTKKLPDGTLAITSYKGSDTEVTVPAKIGSAFVTVIGREAFSCSHYSGRNISEETIASRQSVRSVKVPMGITKIEYDAFFLCQNLEKIFIPASVTEINMFNFDGSSDGFAIHAPAGCYAEQFAKERSIPFVAE